MFLVMFLFEAALCLFQNVFAVTNQRYVYKCLTGLSREVVVFLFINEELKL